MSETGIVVGLHGDQAIVEMEASKECESCGACRYTSTGRMVAPVHNTLDAKIGDTVRIDIEPRMVVEAALIVYVLPLAMFFTGYLIFSFAGGALGFGAESTGIIGGLAFLVLSFLVVSRVDRAAGVSRRFEPKMYDIIHENSAGR